MACFDLRMTAAELQRKLKGEMTMCGSLLFYLSYKYYYCEVKLHEWRNFTCTGLANINSQLNYFAK
jgi:hypothetical protein